jgi:hypothetical protein
MAFSREDAIQKAAPRPVVTVYDKDWGDVNLRWPTFGEWHGLVTPHRKAKALGEEPSAELMARTLAVCLANPDGSRMLTDHEAGKLMEREHLPVMRVYMQCWQTVLKFGEDEVEQAGKN